MPTFVGYAAFVTLGSKEPFAALNINDGFGFVINYCEKNGVASYRFETKHGALKHFCRVNDDPLVCGRPTHDRSPTAWLSHLG